MMEKIQLVSIKDIVPDPGNLREVFDEEEIRALADNLLEIGQTDPIQVFERQDGTFDLFDGERRWRAAKLAGMTELKAIIIERPSNEELLVKKVSRLMQTKTLGFPEEVRALEQGLRALGCEVDQSKWVAAAKKLGVPLGVLRERMRIRQLSPKLQKDFEIGELDYTIAQTLGRIQDVNRQENLAKFIEESKLSNRFVTTKFIQAALEHSDKTPMEVYEVARQQERFRYAEPRKEELQETTIDKLDIMLSDVQRVQGWLETVSRDNFLNELNESKFNARRFWMSISRLRGMLDAFIRVNLPKYTPENPEDVVQIRELTGTTERFLPSGKGS